jgi:DNA-binding response OmpR family regulator
MITNATRCSRVVCRCATNGREALDAFNYERPYLTVTDVKMPVMEGLELLKEAHTLDPDAVVLILTGVGDVMTAVKSLTGGAYDFILKPVTPEELLEAAQRALEHGQVLARRREEHEILERRVAEATRQLDFTLHQLEDTYRCTLEALGRLSILVMSPPTRTPGACETTHYSWRRRTDCLSRRCEISSAACSCMTSAKSESRIPSCSRPGF